MTETELETILVLESDILVRHPLAEYLRECGYRVIETSNPDEAREVIESDQAAVDILFVSAVGQGDDGGFALASWARSRRPGLEVVLSAALKAATEKAADLCEDGAAPTTPYGHRFLHDRIRRLLATRARAGGQARGLSPG